MTVEQLRKACEIMTGQSDGNTDNRVSNNDSVSFLKSVTMSCKVFGHTTEAAKDARKKCTQ